MKMTYLDVKATHGPNNPCPAYRFAMLPDGQWQCVDCGAYLIWVTLDVVESRDAWTGPCTDIKVLTGAEAVRRRPSLYGLTDNALAGMSTEDLDAVALTVEAEHFVVRREAEGRCVQCAHPWYDGMCECGHGKADDEGHDLLQRIYEHPQVHKILRSLP